MSILETIRFTSRMLSRSRVPKAAPAKVARLQEIRLRRLLTRVVECSRFYREKFRGIDVTRCRLEDLPVTTKAEMMEHFDRFLTVPGLRRADLEAFTSDPGRLGRWYQGRYAVSRTSGTQGMQALIVQDRPMLELLHALQVTRGTVFASDPVGVVRRFLRPARLAVVTIGRGFYPSAVGLAYAPAAAHRFVERLWLTDLDPLGDAVDRLNRYHPLPATLDHFSLRFRLVD